MYTHENLLERGQTPVENPPSGSNGILAETAYRFKQFVCLFMPYSGEKLHGQAPFAPCPDNHFDPAIRVIRG